MRKTTPNRRLDPMAREVDRLLAKLANSGPRPAREAESSSSGPATDRRTTPRRSRTVVLSAKAPSRGQVAALWARLLLGLALGGAMTQWPYRHGCDLPLLGYLGAVTVVLIAGAWGAFTAWRMRSGPGHVLALMLMFWGIVLAAEQVLPRVGYAADQERWRCVMQSGAGRH